MNRGYFADMKEFKEHGGKVMDATYNFYYLAMHGLDAVAIPVTVI